jgi:hypothetical protein
MCFNHAITTGQGFRPWVYTQDAHRLRQRPRPAPPQL